MPKDAIAFNDSSSWWSRVLVPLFSIPPYGQPGNPLTISMQAKISDASDQEFWHNVSVSFASDKNYEASSNEMVLVKEPASLSYAYFDVKEEVSTETGKKGQRADAEPGEVVTFTITVRNIGDIAGKALFNTHLPKGLTYVKDSFCIHGLSNGDVILSEHPFLRANLVVAAYGQSGDLLTLCFQASLDNSLPAEATRLTHASTVQPIGENIQQYAAISNPVVIVVQR